MVGLSYVGESLLVFDGAENNQRSSSAVATREVCVLGIYYVLIAFCCYICFGIGLLHFSRFSQLGRSRQQAKVDI